MERREGRNGTCDVRAEMNPEKTREQRGTPWQSLDGAD